MLGWLLRLLVVGLLIRLVMGTLSTLAPRRPSSPSRSSAGSQKRGVLVRDPVCGTYVEPSHALSARTGQATTYFCSERCRREFLER